MTDINEEHSIKINVLSPIGLSHFVFHVISKSQSVRDLVRQPIPVIGGSFLEIKCHGVND